MLFEEQPTDLHLVRYLLGEIYDDLDGRVFRAKYLAALDSDFGGAEGTVVFGGTPAFLAYQDARCSWVAGNYVATVLVCQALLENLLTAYLHAACIEVAKRPRLEQTLRKCRTQGLLSKQDEADIVRLVKQRNPLTHFRLLEDLDHLDRRAVNSGTHPVSIAQEDARFAITLVVRILGKAIFASGGTRTKTRTPLK
jgi:hypothetical protein